MKSYNLKQLSLNTFRQKSIAEAVNSLKSLSGIEEIRDVVDCVKRIYTNLPKEIEGVLYPKSLDELCKKPSHFFLTAHMLGKKCLLIKSVSDFADSDKGDTYHKMCSYSSAWFLFEFLKYTF